MTKRGKDKMIKTVRGIIVIFLMLIMVVIALAFLYRNNEEPERIEKNQNTELYMEDIEDYSIVTSYGDLLFPKVWNEYIKTEIIKKDNNETIQFWVELEGKDKIHIFDIIFGGEGYKIGTIKKDDLEQIDVNVVSYNYYLDATWTDSEKEILSAIDHDINYLLENMTELEEFVPAE